MIYSCHFDKHIVISLNNNYFHSIIFSLNNSTDVLNTSFNSEAHDTKEIIVLILVQKILESAWRNSLGTLGNFA